MRRKKLILNALILTISTLSLSFIGMSFRVYLANKIGSEGMGLFTLIMSTFIMATTIAISGIRVTTTRLIAEELGKNNTSNIKEIMKSSIFYSLLFSVLIFSIMYYGAEFIGEHFIKDTRSIVPLKILSFSLPFIGVGACFHGYFYGMRKVIRSVSADIVESAVMMGIIVSFMGIYLDKGLDFTCALISVGMSVGNIMSTVYFYILFIFDKIPKSPNTQNKNFGVSKIFSISFPIACSAYIQMGLKTIEDLLIPDALRKFGSSSSSSLAIFGVIKGMALPMLYFPAVFLSSFSTLIIPEISEAFALNQRKRVNYIISEVFKFTLLIAIFSTGLFMIFSNEFGTNLYNDEKVSIMLKVLAPLIPFMYLDRIVDGSLNALDEQMATLKFNLIDMSMRLFLIIYLIPKKGIEGFIFVLFAGTLLNSSLSIGKLLKVTKLEFKIFDWILKPSLAIFLGGNLVKLISNNISLNLFFIVTLTIISYLIFLILFRCVTKKDFMWFVDAFKTDLVGENLFEFSITRRF